MDPRLRRVLLPNLAVWLGLLALLALTTAAAYAPLRGLNAVANLAIAAVEVALVGLFFMSLRRPDPLLRLAALAALFWLAALFAMTFSDVLTRVAVG